MLAIGFIIISCIVTIIIAVNSPNDMDNIYLRAYQDVNDNIHEIMKKETEFNENFLVNVDKDNFIIGKNSFELKITDTNNQAIDGAKIDLLLTRPNSSQLDQKLIESKNENGIYYFENFELKNLGRWQIESRIEIDKYVGFYRTEINATE